MNYGSILEEVMAEYLVTFADQSAVKVQAPRGPGQARAIAQDQRLKRYGMPDWTTGTDQTHPRFNFVRIVDVRPVS